MSNTNENQSVAKTNINWYPGHMAKTKRQIQDDLKLVDVVIELLDARIPLASQNPDIAKMVQNKKRIVILNKSDLADENETKRWQSFFDRNNIPSIIANSNTGVGSKELIKKIKEIMQDELEKQSQRGRIQKNIRIMIVGIPNVGKSSLINRLAKRNTATVGNKPGVTKQKQWIRIEDNIELLDTPGVLWPKFESNEIALNLAYIGTIKDEIIDEYEIAYNLVDFLKNHYAQNLQNRYNIDDENIKQDVIMLMELIGRKRGAIISGGRIDETKLARLILDDFRSGKLGRITLEKVK